MSKKIKRTYMVKEEHDEWLDRMSERYDVDKSFLVRRAMQYYMKRGISKDKFLRQYSGEEI